MKALVFNSHNRILSLQDVEKPTITCPNSVLVAARYTGICGTDLHILQGEFPCKSGDVILGHEIAGVVLEVGSSVSHVKVGDKVGIDPNDGCGGLCVPCGEGKPHFCEADALSRILGIALNGGFCQIFEAPAHKVQRLPDLLKLETGFLVEPLSCILHGREIVGPLKPGTRTLILGGGFIGRLWGCLLHHEGQRDLSISEPAEGRRSPLKELDVFKHVFSPEELCKSMEGRSNQFDLIIDACGNGKAVQKALDWVARGGTLCVFACAAPKEEVRLNLFQVYEKELRIVGSKINPFTFNKAKMLAEAMQERYLKLDKLGVKKYSLEQFEEAFEDLKTGRIAKSVFEFPEQ